jgi:hypothetical protein
MRAVIYPAPKALIETFAAALQEPHTALIARVIKVLGAERAETFLAAAQAIEADGGMRRTDGGGRRTPGGVFFALIRQHVTAKERYRIFGWVPEAQKAQEAAEPACTWDAVQQARATFVDPPQEATMKLTLIGRPGTTQRRGQAIIFQLQGQAAPTLPKGLPLPPPETLLWTVLVGLRQWQKVEAQLAADPKDRLLIEGYPCRLGDQLALLAMNCQSIGAQQARKAAQQTGSEGGQPTPR